MAEALPVILSVRRNQLNHLLSRVTMMKLKYNGAEATESGDYYQLHFGEAGESAVEGTPYSLIQRDFEDDSDLFYIETNDDSSIGHAKILQATLAPGSLYLKTKMHPWREILIEFETSPLGYSELENVFKIMFEDVPA